MSVLCFHASLQPPFLLEAKEGMREDAVWGNKRIMMDVSWYFNQQHQWPHHNRKALLWTDHTKGNTKFHMTGFPIRSSWQLSKTERNPLNLARMVPKFKISCNKCSECNSLLSQERFSNSKLYVEIISLTPNPIEGCWWSLWECHTCSWRWPLSAFAHGEGWTHRHSSPAEGQPCRRSRFP